MNAVSKECVDGHLLAEDYDLRRNFRPYVRLETVTMSKNRRAESYNWN